MKYYLATTDISEIWDLDSKLLLLGPWCLTGKKNKKLLEGKDYTLISSPWKPAFKIKEAADYCHRIYEKVLSQLSESLNSIHRVSYPLRYWRVLVGPWLLHFIGVLYDRYSRMEKAIELFSDFHTHVLPVEQCELVSYNMHDFLDRKINEDYYNLKIFSLMAYELCPEKTLVNGYKREFVTFIQTNRARYSLKRKVYYNLINLLDLFFKPSIVLNNMYHLTSLDMVLLKLKAGLRVVSPLDCKPIYVDSFKKKHSHNFRKDLGLKDAPGRFESLLYKVLPDAIPIAYMENYKIYRDKISGIKSLKYLRVIGSAVGWSFDEVFKFFAAEAVSKEIKLIEFQHGGGYGTSLALPTETLALEKDIFYTWGWNSKKNENIKPLPSPHLSRLKNTHSPRVDNVLFVDIVFPRYQYRFHTFLLPDDMPKYFEDKEKFFQALPEEIKNRVLYRPYPYDYGWGELDAVKEVCPNVQVAEGRLVDWMQKAKLVVISHPISSFIEALTINVPTVLYWDREVYLMRPEAEEYFKLLRDAGILFKDPLSAARKVEEIFNDPLSWWLQEDIQKARFEFCKQYAYARKDWAKIWVEELKQLLTGHND